MCFELWSELVIDCCLTPSKQLFSFYHKEKKVHLWQMMTTSSPMYWTDTLCWVFIVLSLCNNSPRIDMWSNFDTLSWFRANVTIHRYSRSKRVDNIDIPCFCARTQQLSNLNTFFRFLCVLGSCYVLSIWVQKSYLKSSIAECILPEALNITIKRQNWIQNTNSESFSNMKFRISNRLSQIKLVIFF